MAFPYTGYPDGVAYPTTPLGTSVVNVSSSSALTTALANATAGQRIVLASGTYSGAFTVAKAGTSTAGISVEAGTTGGAVFAAGSTFAISNSAYVTLGGLVFPYELSSGGNIVKFTGTSNRCRVTRCMFGPASLGTMSTTRTVYILVTDDCEHIRIDHCELRNKANYGNPIIVDGNASNQANKHIRIDHNYIHHIAPEAVDAKEPVQLGVVAASKSLSYSVVERNVFADCGAGLEVVAMDSSGNQMSGNTFLRCAGGVVYRHGTGGVITDNYILDTGTTGGGTGGGGTDGSYRYYKFAPSALRNAATADSVQLSEFAVLNGTTRLTGMTITATNNNSPVGEEPAKAGDDNTTTKWLSLNKTASTLVYDFGSNIAATGYRWATANDATERDPVSWTVQASTDNATWTTLDTRTNYSTTTARNTFLPDFGWGGAGGVGGGSGGGTGGTQTLGVGGVATPPGAILATSDTTSALNISQSGTASNPRVYDGQGHTVGRVTITGDYVVVQNYNIRSGNQYGVVLDDASNVTLQNCDIANVRPSGDGDLNAITLWGGTNVKILYNTAINFVGVSDPGSSHTDWLQGWISSSHPNASTNVHVIGNKATGPANPSRANSVPSLHQCIMLESAGRGGNSGGSGTQDRWYIADNEFGDSWNQCFKFDTASTNMIITRNIFSGSSDRVIENDAGSGVKFYSDNQVTGNYGSIGMTVTSGPGPTTAPF